MEESIVIQLYQILAYYTAYRNLYGHLIIALRWSHKVIPILKVNPPNKIHIFLVKYKLKKYNGFF